MNLLESFSKVLYIDLTKKSFYIKDKKDLFQKYLGGTGVATQLFKEECPKGIDPSSPENPIIFSIGPLVGLFPLASKTVAMFKSPLTGNLGESHAGGRSAIAIRFAGYGAIVIKGSSEQPIYIAIHGNRIAFKDAAPIWGMNSCFTVGSILRQNEPGSGNRSIMRIGIAGEKQVAFSAVVTETFRHFGRMGLGAVFGSKNLKGIVISGENSFKVDDKVAYKKIYHSIYKKATKSPLMNKYHDLGTSGNILPLNQLKALPTQNLKKSEFDKAKNISGESFAQNYLGRRLACSHCPVGCIHIAALREPYKNKPYFYKTTMIGYDFELIYAFGSMLGVDDPEGVLKLIDTAERVCLDIMSTGVVLAWATEMFEKKIITEKETNNLELKWGDTKTYIQVIHQLISQPTDFYKALGKGCAYASSIYGGEDFALAFGGNEMAGYHTGPAGYLGYLLGCRHSHLDNGGYSIDQKELMDTNLTPEEIIRRLMTEESWRQILSSLSVCFFARGVYSTDLVREALNFVGFNLSDNQLSKLGNDIYKEKYSLKLREGFSFDHLKIPERIFETPSPSMQFDRDFITKAIQYAKEKLIH